MGGRLEETKERSSAEEEGMEPKGEIEGKYEPEVRVDGHKPKEQVEGEHKLNNEGTGWRGRGNRRNGTQTESGDGLRRWVNSDLLGSRAWASVT